MPLSPAKAMFCGERAEAAWPEATASAAAPPSSAATRQDIGGRIADARIDETNLLEAKQIGRMSSVVELIGGRNSVASLVTPKYLSDRA